jgi:tRNA A-37 threonylcarbamoyl transferase component Bud32
MEQAIDLTAGGVRWRLARELVGRELFGPGGLRLAEWLAAGQARVVKDAPHCAVYHVVLPGLDFHVKHYRPQGARARLRARLRPSKARSECDRTLAAAGRGVPTLEVLAVGEGAEAEGCYLLTRTLAGARPLAAFLEDELPALGPGRQARVRRRLAVELGRFLSRLHAAGVVHYDLHPGNVLLRLEGDAPRPYLIDLHAARVGGALDWPARRANLVVLNRWFALRATRADRLRCWLTYQRASEEGRAHACGSRLGREAARDLERRTLASNLRFWRARDRRCLGGNRWFRRVRSAAASGHAVADLDPAVLAPLLADPDGPFRRPGATVLKDSPSSTVIEFDLPVAGAVRRVVYKRFAVTRWSDPWAALFRPPPALRSYVLGHGLRLRGLPTPRPLAVFHRRRHGLCREGYLLTEQVPDASDLLTHFARLSRLPNAEGRAALRDLIPRAARLIAALHARRLSHRDLKAANLLASPARWFVSGRGAAERGAAATLSAYQLWFIDLVGVSVRPRQTPARRARDLSRLYASFHGRREATRTDCLRFLCAYLSWGQGCRSGWKGWWRAVAAAARAKVRRNLRNGRPLG